jgi:arginine:ornithine antiporter / lysine permease
MSKQTLGLPLLTALVVGNMIGSGIMLLPRQLSEVASPAGVILGWLINGAGVLMLALVFGNLAVRKPELSSGIQMHARALFPDGSKSSILAGYLIAWGYWVANWSGNVAIITTFSSYLSTFFPMLSSKEPLFAIGVFTISVGGLLTFFVCTMLLWGMHAIILQGIMGAGKMNFIATSAKVLGFILFIVVALTAFESRLLAPFASGIIDPSGQAVNLSGQINQAAVITLWAFIGVESAVVFSSRAPKRAHVKIATIAGLTIAVIVYIGISTLTMGTMPREQLLASDKPLADALSLVVGDMGMYLMSGLALIALIGSMIGWILLSAEVPYQAAKQGLFPPIFLKENKKGTPVTALFLSNFAAQVLIFSVLSNTLADAYLFIITLATLSYLVPYILSTLYQVKLVWTGDTYTGQSRFRWVDGIIAVLGAVYSVWIIRAGTADMRTFLLGVALLLVGFIFYPYVKKTASSRDGLLTHERTND